MSKVMNLSEPCVEQGEPAEDYSDKAEGVQVTASFTANVWEVSLDLASRMAL